MGPSRAQTKPLSDPLPMACPMPFFPNSGNYVGTGEHDKNPRKYWYLVLSHGVFTKKCVTVVWPPFWLLNLPELMQIQRQRAPPKSTSSSRRTTLGTSGLRTAFCVTLTTATATSSGTPRTVRRRQAARTTAYLCTPFHQPLGTKLPLPLLRTTRLLHTVPLCERRSKPPLRQSASCRAFPHRLPGLRGAPLSRRSWPSRWSMCCRSSGTTPRR